MIKNTKYEPQGGLQTIQKNGSASKKEVYLS